MKRQIVILICKNCGKTIQFPTRKNQKYCVKSNCSKNHWMRKNG